MERMRIASAERARKFEQAERDSQSHALAYQRGMEETRRRRAEDEERRRRADDDRRRLEEERNANRARKLKAMGSRPGAESWDDGKDADDGSGRAFRSANGGVRGVRRDGGGGGGGGEPREVFSADEFRGGGRGGRGRGGRGSGRGGRRGGGHYDGERGFYNDNNNNHNNGNGNGAARPNNNKTSTPQTLPTEADFPALPPSTKKLDTTTTTPALDPLQFPSLTPGGDDEAPVGKWDDEMEALDAKRGI